MSSESSRTRRNVNLAQFLAPGATGTPPPRSTQPPSRQSADVDMRSALSDDEEPPAGQDVSAPALALNVQTVLADRRRAFDTSDLLPKKGQNVTTYTPQPSQTPSNAQPEPAMPEIMPVHLAAAHDDQTSPAIADGLELYKDLAPMTSLDLGALNSRALEAVLVSSSFIKYHLRDLVWMKSRLVEHQARVIRCRNLTARNLMAIERALYIEEKKDDLERALGYRRCRWVRLTLGGDIFRIRISNAFGGSDLPITSVSISLPTNGSSGVSSVQEGTSQKLSFSGEESVVIPIGALVVSDPVRVGGRGGLKPGTVVTVTIYSREGQASNSVTSHPGSRTTSWFIRGDQLDALDFPSEASEGVEAKAGVAHWYWLSAVEVWTSRRNSALVIVGDSITDGRGSTDNANNRWPDLLHQRFLSSRRPTLQSLSIINQAAGGNRILNDGLGPNGLSRIDRDVLSHSRVTHAIIYIGVNDIGTASTSPSVQSALASRLIWSFKQMAERLHAHDIVVLGATITPFSGPGQGYSDPNREQTRQTVNSWIRRNGGVFDAVLDFDRILADPANPAQLKEEFNTGDYLHPNVAGFQALADGIPLGVFELKL